MLSGEAGSWQMLILLSAMAGAVHVLAPDHWVPASILAWRQRWSPIQVAAVGSLAFGLHVLVGFLIFACFPDFFLDLASVGLMTFTLAIVGLFSILRALRYWRIGQAFHIGTNRFWGIATMLSLLGPCESIVPVLIKARQMGAGYLVAVVAFGAGSVASGISLILLGRFLWDRPILLPQALAWAYRRRSVLPVSAVVVAGLAYLVSLKS
jgi:hypothetical protein